MKRIVPVRVAPARVPPQRGQPPKRLRPEFGDVIAVRDVFGLRETLAYRLLAEGKITGIVIRAKGKTRGKRLFDFASIRRYLASLKSSEQEQTRHPEELLSEEGTLV